MTKEEFKKMVGYIVSDAQAHSIHVQKMRTAEIAKHDPIFAKLWQAGLDAAEAQIAYLKTRLEK